MNKHFIILAICFILTACGGGTTDTATASAASTEVNVAQGGAEPAWVSKPNATYPEASFIVGVGYSSTRQRAETAAYTALSNYIVQEISVNTVATQQTSMGGKDFNQTANVNQEMVSSSNISKLTGVGIKEVWFDGKSTYYALAVLNKSDTASFYIDKVRANIDAIEELQDVAKQNAGTFESNKALNSAILLATENLEYLTILVTMDNNRRKLLEAQSPTPASLALEAKEDAKNIHLDIKVTGEYNGDVRSYLMEYFANKGIGTATSSDKARYVVDCAVGFINLADQGQNKFVMVAFSGDIKDTVTGKTIHSFNKESRSGHVSRIQAVQRGLAGLKTYINSSEFDF